ncbi:MAG: pyruvate kinase [Verrucomicrobiae bacterium]|nr:pyruvate kinase [Verrucomicrobiae bacterium]
MEQPPRFRHTKIIATLGPATDSPEQLARVISEGVDILRLNMAHATPDWCLERIARIREVSAQVGRQVAVMMDVKGPEIRTGPVEQAIKLVPGETFQFFIEGASPPEDGRGVAVNYANLPNDVEIDKPVLVDSGLIRLKVIAKDHERVHCEVVIGGNLGSRRHINLPGVKVKLPALTDKDRIDLNAGAEAGIDFVALSFVRDAPDILELREYLDGISSRARIIAKIEDQAGVENVMAIVKATDAVMVARGDLGIEIDYHRLPIVQRQIVTACQMEGKPVIIATHLLESMIHCPVPTRAEISDVSNAVREQADAVMLSGETTTGSFPMESIDVLKNILATIEPTVPYQLNTEIKLHEPKSKMLRSAAVLAQELGADSGIVVFTRSGFLGYVLGAMRARGVPIFAFTDDECVFRQLLLPWGVEPFLMEFTDANPEETIVRALDTLRAKNWRPSGATLIVITNVLAGEKTIDSLQLRTID